jgi:hypothetical protein
MEHKDKPTPRKQVRWQDIHNRMTRRGVPAHLVSAAVEAFKERAADAKREKLFAYQHRRFWSALLRPLMYELDSSRTGLRYARNTTPDNTQKIEALEAYVIVLEELAMRLVAHRDDKAHTPSRLAQLYNNEYKKRMKGHLIPNHGEHWTDWVPRHIKLRVSDLFAFAPRLPRAKPRLPFQRTMPPSMNSRAESALRKRILNEMGPIELMVSTYPDHPDLPKWQAKLDKMRKALNMLLNMKPHDFVPTTWQSLVGAQLDVPESEEELEQSFRDAHAGRDEE